MAIANARYGHTNLIARDWQRLAHFYEEVFGCVPVPPERDYRSADLDRGTGLRGLADRVAAIDGRLEIDSKPGRGTIVRARLPSPEPARGGGLRATVSARAASPAR